MNLLQKEFVIKKSGSLTVELIENTIKKMGYEPLRWAIVRTDENNFIVDAVVITEGEENA